MSDRDGAGKGQRNDHHNWAKAMSLLISATLFVWIVASFLSARGYFYVGGPQIGLENQKIEIELKRSEVEGGGAKKTGLPIQIDEEKLAEDLSKKVQNYIDAENNKFQNSIDRRVQDTWSSVQGIGLISGLFGVLMTLLVLYFSFNTTDLLREKMEILIPEGVKGMLPAELATQLATQLETQLGPQLEIELNKRLSEALEEPMTKRLPSVLEAHLPTQLATQLATQLGPQLEIELNKRLSKALEKPLADQLPTQLLIQLPQQLRMELPTQLNAELDKRLSIALIGQLTEKLPSVLAIQLGPQLEIELRSQLSRALVKPLEDQLPEALNKMLTEIFNQTLLSLTKQPHDETRKMSGSIAMIALLDKSIRTHVSDESIPNPHLQKGLPVGEGGKSNRAGSDDVSETKAEDRNEVVIPPTSEENA